jgi:outer membrane biosynthesis protein TonB
MVRATPPTPGQHSAPALVARIELRSDPAAAEQSEPSRSADLPEAQSEPSQFASAEAAAQATAANSSRTQQVSQAARPQIEESRPAIEIAPLRDPTYYPIGQLDRLPILLGTADACYPDGASGEVAFLLLIDDTGTVNEAAIVDAKPEGLFTAAAVESCRALKFTPARKDGRAVRSRVRFVVGPKPPG